MNLFISSEVAGGIGTTVGFGVGIGLGVGVEDGSGVVVGTGVAVGLGLILTVSDALSTFSPLRFPSISPPIITNPTTTKLSITIPTNSFIKSFPNTAQF